MPRIISIYHEMEARGSVSYWGYWSVSASAAMGGAHDGGGGGGGGGGSGGGGGGGGSGSGALQAVQVVLLLPHVVSSATGAMLALQHVSVASTLPRGVALLRVQP